MNNDKILILQNVKPDIINKLLLKYDSLETLIIKSLYLNGDGLDAKLNNLPITLKSLIIYRSRYNNTIYVEKLKEYCEYRIKIPFGCNIQLLLTHRTSEYLYFNCDYVIDSYTYVHDKHIKFIVNKIGKKDRYVLITKDDRYNF